MHRLTNMSTYPKLRITSAKGSNQLSANASLPTALGCTPSPVIFAVSKPVQQSTTETGLSSVETVGTHSATTALRASTREPHCGQLEGAMGMIWAN